MNFFGKLAVGACATLGFAGAALAVPAPYPNPGTESTTVASFSAGVSGLLVLWYTGNVAGFTNYAFAQINGVDTGTCLDSQTSTYGDLCSVGAVTAGDSIVFGIYVQDTDTKYYSNPALNDDGINHVYFANYDGDSFVPAGFNFQWEDLAGGGDFSYGDHSYIATIQAVPEPASWALMITGFGLAGIAVRRRRALAHA